jgi:hypothetical protein
MKSYIWHNRDWLRQTHVLCGCLQVAAQLPVSSLPYPDAPSLNLEPSHPTHATGLLPSASAAMVPTSSLRLTSPPSERADTAKEATEAVMPSPSPHAACGGFTRLVSTDSAEQSTRPHLQVTSALSVPATSTPLSTAGQPRKRDLAQFISDALIGVVNMIIVRIA